MKRSIYVLIACAYSVLFCAGCGAGKLAGDMSQMTTCLLYTSKQACAFAQSYDAFRERDVVVIGISKDSVASHVKFAEKHQLPFILLSDPELEAIQAYDVWKEKKLYGKVSMGVVRTTCLLYTSRCV